MAFIKSYSSSSAGLVRQFIVPSALQVVLYILIAGALLIVFNARDIWDSLGAGIIFNDTPDGQTKSGFVDFISSGRLPQIIFWGVIGMVMYAVVWFGWNVLTNLRNDMAADDFVHPKTYSRTKYWSSVWGHKIFFAVSMIVLAAYIYIFFKLLTLLAGLSYDAVDNFDTFGSPLELGIYLIVIATLVHIFALLLRVTANSWRSIYKDL